MDAAGGFVPADNAGAPVDASAPDLSDEDDYSEVRGLYLYRVHVKPRITRQPTYEISDVLPWSLQNIDIYRTTEPKDGVRDESYLINHADDLSILMYDAQGVLVPRAGTTRFELVLPEEIFKENDRSYVWVRPGRKSQYQKTSRPLDCLF